MAQMTIEEARQHAAQLLRDGSYCGPLLESMRRAMPQYLWMDREANEGWCTQCERWIPLEEVENQGPPGMILGDPYRDEQAEWQPVCGWPNWAYSSDKCSQQPRHKRFTVCPNCGEFVQMRDLWRGRRSMAPDARFFVVHGRSAIDDKTLVMVGFSAHADWSRMDNAEPCQMMEVEPMEICVFPWRKPGKKFVAQWDYHAGRMRWKKARECRSGYNPSTSPFSRVIECYRPDDLQEAASGTPFETVLRLAQNATYRSQASRCIDQISLINRASRFGCVEYLLRMGFDECARAVLDGENAQLLNYRGKTPCSVLRLTTDEWAEVKGKGIRVTPDLLTARNTARAHRLKTNMEMLCWIARNARIYAFTEFCRSGIQAPEKGLKYCRRKGVRLKDYADHIRMLQQLGMSQKDKEWAYPKNFGEAHAALSSRTAAIRAEELSKGKDGETGLIRQRMESGELDEYIFSALGLVIRPMVSAKEIIFEGTVQDICIANYVETYAQKRDVLCVIRRETDLGTPLYAVEFSKEGQLVQCRGYRNGKPDKKDNLELFWRLFEDARAQLHKQRERSKTA